MLVVRSWLVVSVALLVIRPRPLSEKSFKKNQIILNENLLLATR